MEGFNAGKYIDEDHYREEKPTWPEDARWKASHIARMLDRHAIAPRTMVEIGCGTGLVLQALAERYPADIEGYDLSSNAIAIAQKKSTPRLRFFNEDPLARGDTKHYDVLLGIDVFEHVPDYLGFLKLCRDKATFKVYHIPLDIHVSAVLRNSLIDVRHTIGHLHHFTEATALATLTDTQHEIIDWCYTAGAVDSFRRHITLKRALTHLPRMVLGKLSPRLAARLLGGYSLLALCR